MILDLNKVVHKSQITNDEFFLKPMRRTRVFLQFLKHTFFWHLLTSLLQLILQGTGGSTVTHASFVFLEDSCAGSMIPMPESA